MNKRIKFGKMEGDAESGHMDITLNGERIGWIEKETNAIDVGITTTAWKSHVAGYQLVIFAELNPAHAEKWGPFATDDGLDRFFEVSTKPGKRCAFGIREHHPIPGEARRTLGMVKRFVREVVV